MGIDRARTPTTRETAAGALVAGAPASSCAPRRADPFIMVKTLARGYDKTARGKEWKSRYS
ncbi:hypothetical protein GCM10010399_92090 [Dactylosporangium fulvum]|uniref:Uncharacterized protein n=1 Tax=Dactylosporangium fulvum TaxID=53359 RepID=A0ABY5VWB9_9ACTN|nr:hypothetical protein [Dactylosporangium fulvum]UWP81089.1 hypothetical protein Dfulv_39145 [Dactylosporangium fulvum]